MGEVLGEREDGAVTALVGGVTAVAEDEAAAVECVTGAVVVFVTSVVVAGAVE